MRVPTVRVKNDSAPDGYVVINESDLSTEHELWPEQGDPAERSAPQTEQAIALRCMAVILARRDGKTAAEWSAQPGVARLEQLQAAEGEINAVAEPLGQTIPADWQDMHWKSQVKLAKSLGFDGDALDGAKAFITMKLEERAAR